MKEIDLSKWTKKDLIEWDDDILIGESYHTDINGCKYCSLECLLESYEVEEKILNENDFSI